jgi:phosphate transport system substrate-binding protein
MRRISTSTIPALACLSALSFSLVLAGCGCGNEKPADSAGTTGTASTATGETPLTGGKLVIDGSGTVYPIVSLMAEDFKKANSGVDNTVGKAGTGSGMQKFIRGETDIATASRPIEQKEVDALKAANIEFIEVPIAYDGVSIVVNPANSFATSLTVEELKKAWSPDSTVKLWSDIRAGFPADKITFYGPTDNHGTYEYFTEAINKKKNAIRSEYQANQEYPAIITAVAGDKGGIGYIGYSYYAENKDKVKLVGVDAGKGAVLPEEKTIADGTYTPLSRPLFLYVSKKAYDSKPEVKKFVEFALSEGGIADVKESQFVPLPTDALDAVKKRVAAATTGSAFMDAKPGMTITEILSKETAGQ